MRDILDRYVRSLAEREHAGSAPEHRQDLGTFVGWLLQRHGFTVLLHAYKRDGLLRVKSAGRRQFGVDIVASRPDDDGQDRIFLFVLKHGDIRASQWQPGTPGSLPHDLWLAAGGDPADHARNAPGEQRPKTERVTVVAVHNGNLDREDLKTHVDRQLEKMREQCAVETDWWDAQRLVDLALEAPADGAMAALERQADAGLFPPTVQPFARLALDSLVRVKDGAHFDLDAVDRLISESLPAVFAANEQPEARALNPATALQIYRKLTELSLFAEMVRVQCDLLAEGLTLPTLDTLERVLCRAMAVLARLPDNEAAQHAKLIRDVLTALIAQYVRVAARLRDRIAPLLAFDNGLAMAAPSEQIDYPLRVLRISGYLATAGAAALDADDEAEASEFASTLLALWEKNPAAAYGPVTDDQIIELALVWTLWLRLGRRGDVGNTAHEVHDRLVMRRRFGHPLPAAYQRARAPFRGDHQDARVLASVYFGGGNRVPGFEDGCSTILPLTAYLAHRLGSLDHDGWIAVFAPAKQTDAEGMGRPLVPVSPQAWQPPADAAQQWYLEEIVHRGTARVFGLEEGTAALADEFEDAAVPLPASPAEDWAVPVVDRMAWKLWRTPPPMSLLIVPRDDFGDDKDSTL